MTEHVRIARDSPAATRGAIPDRLVVAGRQVSSGGSCVTATSLGPGVNVTSARTRRGAKAWRGGRHAVHQRPDLRPVPAQPARPDQLDPNPKENGMITMHEKNAMRTRIAAEGSGA